jgi:hypothetical protein
MVPSISSSTELGTCPDAVRASTVKTTAAVLLRRY